MTQNDPRFFDSRRKFLYTSSLGLSLASTPLLLAEELTRTPRQTEGPFYPDKLPLDTDNDLLIINETTTQAIGEITHLTGRILDQNGNPIRNALVEIWQVDNNGSYLHTKSGNRDKWDNNFQGFGRFLTGSKGQYYFRTIKPVPYPGRTPHIHFKVKRKGQPEFVTQCYVKGHKLNQRDGVLRGLKDAKGKASLMVDFKPVKGSKIGELDANFDIVLGRTPEQS